MWHILFHSALFLCFFLSLSLSTDRIFFFSFIYLNLCRFRRHNVVTEGTHRHTHTLWKCVTIAWVYVNDSVPSFNSIALTLHRHATNSEIIQAATFPNNDNDITIDEDILNILRARSHFHRFTTSETPFLPSCDCLDWHYWKPLSWLDDFKKWSYFLVRLGSILKIDAHAEENGTELNCCNIRMMTFRRNCLTHAKSRTGKQHSTNLIRDGRMMWMVENCVTIMSINWWIKFRNGIMYGTVLWTTTYITIIMRQLW